MTRILGHFTQQRLYSLLQALLPALRYFTRQCIFKLMNARHEVMGLSLSHAVSEKLTNYLSVILVMMIMEWKL